MRTTAGDIDSTSGRLSGTSPYSRGKSPVHCHSSTSLLRQPHQHQQPLRRPCRRPSSTSSILYRPCKLSWTNGRSRRMHLKGKVSDTDRNAGKGRNTSCQTTPCSATLSRCPRSRSSSRAPHGPVALTLTPCLSTMDTTILKIPHEVRGCSGIQRGRHHNEGEGACDGPQR
jgi:hypothetical protein